MDCVFPANRLSAFRLQIAAFSALALRKAAFAELHVRGAHRWGTKCFTNVQHLVAALDAVCYGSLFEAFLSAKSGKEKGQENCKKKKVLGFYVEAFSSNEMQCPMREHKSICSRVGRSG